MPSRRSAGAGHPLDVVHDDRNKGARKIPFVIGGRVTLDLQAATATLHYLNDLVVTP